LGASVVGEVLDDVLDDVLVVDEVDTEESDTDVTESPLEQAAATSTSTTVRTAARFRIVRLLVRHTASVTTSVAPLPHAVQGPLTR